jgi:endonuclease-3
MLFDNWKKNLQPLIEKYKDNKHPLAYESLYQLLIMIILAAQDSDANINQISILFFQKYSNITSLSKATPAEISNYISTVENYKNKSNWLSETAKLIQSDDKIPTNLDSLIKIKGVGRKSANVILREINKEPKGIIVDLHVIRVVPRIGLTPELKDGNKVEKILIQQLPYEIWNDIGMAFSFLGREICRPTNPKCKICPINTHCEYFNKL